MTVTDLLHKLDPERAVLCATDKPDIATVFEEMDVIGINYCYSSLASVHEKYPRKPILSSECAATGSTRGWYGEPDTGNARLPAYDRDFNSYFVSREKTWRFIAAHDWIMGGYQWMSIDYRGEAVWPRLCSVSGAIDLYYQKKDAFYQNLSHWSERPMVHLLPHWNHRGLEGEPIRVWAYTNTSRLELFLNGVSHGCLEIMPFGHGEWVVPYEPGTLRVEAYCDGKLVAVDEQCTSGSPHRLKLTLDTTVLYANGQDIALITCSVIDREGREVPDATPEVDFRVEGAGSFYSSGSDINDHISPFSSRRRMYAGKITVAVRVGSDPGEICVFASTEALGTTVLKFPILPQIRENMRRPSFGCFL